MKRDNVSRHVMECLGMSRVVIEDGKVIEVSEPKVKHCPLFRKYRGIEELNTDTVRENIEFRISSFGMCTENRETEMDDVISFGISEILSHALRRGSIDAAVIAADGCGTAVITKPCILQGMGGRISGICETEPIPKVVDAIGPENILDPETTPIDMVAGAEKAFAQGHRTVAITTTSVGDAVAIRDMYGDNAVIVGVHTTGMSDEDAHMALDVFDIITACASRALREGASRRPDVMIAGTKVPIYGVTAKGKELVLSKLEQLGLKPWDGSTSQMPPEPLI